ncbi:MAG: UDP-2,3-diacylglucosamine diphosphatase LpxI [Silicimonas sp.]|nr:UDP-2,3-diacylglucosamine diphosphatase LpxI [Silicimonas sp.]
MLALVAGQGDLPGRLVRALPAQPLICSLEGFLPEKLTPDIVAPIETLGSLLQDLQGRGVTQVCFAGSIRRPAVNPARIDAATWPLVPVIQKALGDGDDAALRAVIAVFEDAGLTVVAPHAVAPDLLPSPGVLGAVQPGDAIKRDAQRAEAVLNALSVADLGQACAVRAGQVLAVEGTFGTDWMLHSLTARPDGGGGIFYKAPKTDQDRRIDLPTIGPNTVTGAAQAGLEAIVIAADGVMVLDLPQVIAACDAAGIALWVREVDGACAST